MSARSVEFFFDFGSAASYLAYTQLPALAQQQGAELIYRPMLLGGVFKATGNVSPVSVPAKGRWMGRDLKQWAQRYGVPFEFNPHFPINTLTLMRGAVGLQRREPARLARYMACVFEAIWVKGENLGDPAVLTAMLKAHGFDADAFIALVSDPEIKQALIATTEEAVARGAFGAPTFFVGKQMFFGQDRLDFVREALA